jgi:hypothetical protein
MSSIAMVRRTASAQASISAHRPGSSDPLVTAASMSPSASPGQAAFTAGSIETCMAMVRAFG